MHILVAYQEYIIAYLYNQLEQSILAVNHCRLALQEFEILDDIRGEADTYSLLGTILMRRAEYETSLVKVLLLPIPSV